MSSTGKATNVIGPSVRADRWSGYTDGLYTIAIYTQELRGRIYIEASLANEPTETDWFPIWLKRNCQFLEYPNHSKTSKVTNNDVDAINVSGKFVWIRARLDRSYLGINSGNIPDGINFGQVEKILLY